LAFLADAKPEKSITCSANDVIAPGGNLLISKFSGYTTEVLIIISSASEAERSGSFLNAATLSNSENVNSLNIISIPFNVYLKNGSISFF
jgi:hypothetical protein